MNSPDQARIRPPPRKSKSSGVVVPNAPRWSQRLGAWVVFALVRAISATLRYRYDDRSGYFDGAQPGPTIYVVWHNRLALCLTGYYAFARKRNPTLGMAAMVSASRDGGFLTSILECFAVRPVRGSSSRRGPQALLELTTWAKRGYDLALTPDGPRGPRYVVQDGVMSLARLTGLPVLPVSYNVGWKIQAKSWDRFQIPLPFSRCDVVIEKPVRIPRETTDAESEALRQQLEQTLRQITRD
jgi:lysophospholipid acyltransferase (LPLAT)-like uncharacterized protein